MNSLKKIGLLLFAFISLQANAQTDKATTQKIIEQKKYVFVATSAIPTNSAEVSRVMDGMSGGATGGNIQLSGSNFDFIVTPDSLVSYLPFYGRAYSGGYSNDEGGYKFKSKDFTYTTTNRKKGGWDVTIRTKDVKDSPRMTMNVSEGGYATLSVISNNKQSITYNGYLKEGKKDQM